MTTGRINQVAVSLLFFQQKKSLRTHTEPKIARDVVARRNKTDEGTTSSSFPRQDRISLAESATRGRVKQILALPRLRPSRSQTQRQGFHRDCNATRKRQGLRMRQSLCRRTSNKVLDECLHSRGVRIERARPENKRRRGAVCGELYPQGRPAAHRRASPRQRINATCRPVHRSAVAMRLSAVRGGLYGTPRTTSEHNQASAGPLLSHAVTHPHAGLRSQNLGETRLGTENRGRKGLEDWEPCLHPTPAFKRTSGAVLRVRKVRKWTPISRFTAQPAMLIELLRNNVLIRYLGVCPLSPYGYNPLRPRGVYAYFALVRTPELFTQTSDLSLITTTVCLHFSARS